MKMTMKMLRVALLVLAVAAACSGILPEIVDSGINIVEEDSARPRTEPDQDRVFVEVEQLPEEKQREPERNNDSVGISPDLQNPFPTSYEKVNESVHTFEDQERNDIADSTVLSSDLGNNIDQGCLTDEDCGKDRYCNSKCLPCKAIDVPCTKDGECCGEQLCVWGQCSQNATKGEAGSTCQHQTDCSPELCCAFHKALLFPVCSEKPIERERCFGASNHLLELLSWDIQDDRPRKHCPCAGDLHCQHLGRGSMCLKGEDSSEEDLTDNLYSEIDYII